jgi:transposase
VVDNVTASVLDPDWFDPNLNPKMADFSRHYGTAVLPTQPARPEHKGKIEAGVKWSILKNTVYAAQHFRSPENSASSNFKKWQKGSPSASGSSSLQH